MATIALVDDDRDILALIATTLESEGYNVVAYPDGPAALNGFKTVQPDLAILDIRMPQMDGVELLRRLRQKSDVPVIFLTGRQEETDELLGLRIGADDFIRKPFSQRVLVERVRTLLRRFRAIETAGERETGDSVMERGNLCLDRERHTCSWKGKKVVLFSVPGAFTPTCDAKHLPGYVELADEIKKKGVDTIACTAVNDVFVMNAWGKLGGVGDKILMLADGNGEYVKSLGLELDASGYGMGHRGQRFAIIARNGVATHVNIEAPGEFKVSAADYVLKQL